MLTRRLGKAVACPEPHACAAPSPPVPPRGCVAATQPVAECSNLALAGGEENIEDRAAIPAAQPNPETYVRSPSSWAAPGHGLDCAFIDVRKALEGPVVRTDALAPQLSAALRSTFGVATSVDPPSHSPTQGETPVVVASFHDQENTFRKAPSVPTEAALWLRDWKIMDLALDSRGLSESLGDVGMPGFAGWLLEYPVVYCCPSLTGTEQENEDGGGAEGGHAGNCLGLVPLTVYSLRLGIGYGASSLPREPHSSDFEAFSFSVPQTVCCLAETAGDHDGDDDWRGVGEDRDDGVTVGLNRKVEMFLERFERRIASHRSSSAGRCERHQHWLERLSVTKHIETLDQVAL